LLKKNSTICLKKQSINIYKAWYKYFRSGICSELTSTWTFKMHSSNTKTTNERTASNNKSDREVLKVKVGFKKPSSGSIPESPNIYIYITYRSIYTRHDTSISDLAYVQNWRVRELLKCILAIQKQLTNRPQVIQIRPATVFSFYIFSKKKLHF
jgi:hypothetical protein